MQAFILAAGLGTRLQPLTNDKPKALVDINGRTLLEIAISNLVQQGVTHIVINIHHFAEMMTNFIQNHSWNAEILISNEKAELLDTGGGLKKASCLFLPKEPIIVHNVDILSHINFEELMTQHIINKDIATLAVSQRDTSRYLLFDSNKQLIGWQNKSKNETKWVSAPISSHTALAFSGISIISPQLLNLLPPAEHPYPIIPEYLSIAKNHRISYFIHKKEDWMDVGKPYSLIQAQNWTFNH